ncbi:MAG TPA: shikimate kinase [Gemmatimonadaceae bacterium]|nr:shikimate kinase [Gemmatimonadaceae bacterium]
MARRLIRLVGPGGAGKSTAGALLAGRLGVPFVDLDGQFAAAQGDIDEFIDTRGYDEYARANVELYRAVAREARGAVFALSSGFMAYPRAVHPRYAVARGAIARSPTTFVLLPSLDLETCVAEIVRRQLARPIRRRSAAREERVIRERFGLYLALPAPKIATMRPPADVAAEIAARLSRGEAALATAGTATGWTGR